MLNYISKSVAGAIQLTTDKYSLINLYILGIMINHARNLNLFTYSEQLRSSMVFNSMYFACFCYAWLLTLIHLFFHFIIFYYIYNIYIYIIHSCLDAQSCPTLCDSLYCSPPGSSVCGIFQTRILEWDFLLQLYIYIYMFLDFIFITV